MACNSVGVVFICMSFNSFCFGAFHSYRQAGRRKSYREMGKSFGAMTSIVPLQKWSVRQQKNSPIFIGEFMYKLLVIAHAVDLILQ